MTDWTLGDGERVRKGDIVRLQDGRTGIVMGPGTSGRPVVMTGDLMQREVGTEQITRKM